MFKSIELETSVLPVVFPLARRLLFYKVETCSFLPLYSSHHLHDVSHGLSDAVYTHPPPGSVLYLTIHPQLADQRHSRALPSSIHQPLASPQVPSRKPLLGRRRCAQEVRADGQDPTAPREYCRCGCDSHHLWSWQRDAEEVGDFNSIKHR